MDPEHLTGRAQPVRAAPEVVVGSFGVPRGGGDLPAVVLDEVELTLGSLERRLEPLKRELSPASRGLCRPVQTPQVRE